MELDPTSSLVVQFQMKSWLFVVPNVRNDHVFVNRKFEEECMKMFV